jgi:7,8-dihydroneopterin aldolase/epimerase/oxygenase
VNAAESTPGAIRILGMRFWGRHGTLEHERTREQPIDLDVELTCDLLPAASSDALADTLDYATIYSACERVVTKESFALLEALAARIARMLLQDPRVHAVRVRARKPRLFDGATPEIELQLRRKP